MDNVSELPIEIYSFLILDFFVSTDVFSFNLKEIREHAEERLKALGVTCKYSNCSEYPVGHGTNNLKHIDESIHILLQSGCLKTETTIRESQIVDIDDYRYFITYHGLKILGDKTCFKESDQHGNGLIIMGILKPGGEITRMNKWDIPIELVGPMMYQQYQESKPIYHPSDFYYG